MIPARVASRSSFTIAAVISRHDGASVSCFGRGRGAVLQLAGGSVSSVRLARLGARPPLLGAAAWPPPRAPVPPRAAALACRSSSCSPRTRWRPASIPSAIARTTRRTSGSRRRSGDHVVGLVGVAVRVHERDHRQAEPLRLADRELLLAEVDDEDRVRLAAHVGDAAEVRLELLELGHHRDPLLRRQQLELALVFSERSSCSRWMRSEIVRQFVSRPPSQRWFTYGIPTRAASPAIASCACFFVPTKRTEPPRSAMARAKL